MALKDDFSPELDGIKMFELNINAFLRLFSQIFSLAISMSSVLNSFKILVITPIWSKISAISLI